MPYITGTFVATPSPATFTGYFRIGFSFECYD
jgi:hypothetical protein